MKKGILTIFVCVTVLSMLMTTGCRKHSESKADYLIDKIANKLELTEDQSEWLDGFKIDLNTEINQIKKERETSREALKNSFIAGILTEEIVNNEISKRCDLIIEKTPLIVSKIEEIHTNLNSEQRIKLTEIVNDFHEKKEKWRKGCNFFKVDKPKMEKLITHISEKIQDELDLSSDQNEWLEGFTSDIIQAQEFKNLKEEIHSVKKQVAEKVMDEFVNDTFDSERITEFIKINLPLEKVKELPIASKVVEFQSNLTPEQRVELVSMINEHKEKRKECWMKRLCVFKK